MGPGVKLLLLKIAALLVSAQVAHAISAVPNASLISGEVLQVSLSREGAPSSVLVVRLLSSEDVEALPNFTKEKVGQSLELYTKQDVSGLKRGDIISVRVQYLGDERGGHFWAIIIAPQAK